MYHSNQEFLLTYTPAEWNRPPNFLLVDYYNVGLPAAGSVFEVAARANNVTYNRPCCGVKPSGASLTVARTGFVAVALALVLAAVAAW